ncbi:MAG: restriction endonuclease subunit S [Gammaproteobacteria bacterium]|nr:restriction endonuclease subunit S [Gammaproteobacteria bacterium]
MIIKRTSKRIERPLADLLEKVIDNRGKTPPLVDAKEIQARNQEVNKSESQIAEFQRSKSKIFPLIESWQIKNHSKHPLEKISRQKYVSEDCYKSWFRDEHPQPQDILLTTVGASIPQYCLAPTDYKISIAQNVVGLRGRRAEVDQDFLRFYFLGEQFLREVNRRIVTAVQPSIKLSSFCDIEVSLPPLPQQKTLGQDLVAMTDKIELLKQQNYTLESIAHATFENCFPTHLRDAQNSKSTKETLLDTVYQFVKGDRVKGLDYATEPSEGKIRYTRVKDMDRLRPAIFADASHIKQRCSVDDLLISFDGTIGKVSFGVEGSYAVAIRKVVSDNEHYNNLGFKYTLFNRAEIIDTINSHATGTVILHASAAIKYLSFPLPSPTEVEKFNRIINPVFDKILLNKKNIVMMEDMLKLAISNVLGQ